MNTTNEINEILNFYYKNSDSQDIAGLLKNQNELVIWFAKLSGEVAEARGQYLAAKTVRKSFISKKRKGYIKDGDSLTKASTLAEDDAGEYYKKEDEAQVLYDQYKLFFESTKEVIGSMKQYISYLKDEAKNVKTASYDS